jgi:hypothetical protein
MFIFACFMHVDVSNWVFESREDISFHFSLGFTALMPRFSGNKSFNSSKYFFNANSIFSMSATNLNSYASLPNGYMVNKDMQSISILSSSNATSSNLNPFGQGALDNPNNLLLVLQALASKMRQFLTSNDFKKSIVFHFLLLSNW